VKNQNAQENIKNACKSTFIPPKVNHSRPARIHKHSTQKATEKTLMNKTINDHVFVSTDRGDLTPLLSTTCLIKV